MRLGYKIFLIIFLIISPLIFINYSTSAEPTTHTIIIYNNYFSNDELLIKIGDRVIFLWADDAKDHNIVQTKSENSIDPLVNGFSSGDPVDAPFEYEIPSNYLSNNQTIYYMCTPHATSGMLGIIQIGLPSSSQNNANFSFSIIALISILVASHNLRSKHH